MSNLVHKCSYLCTGSYILSILLGKNLHVDYGGSYGNSEPNFLRNGKTIFYRGCTTLIFVLAMYEGSNFPKFSPTLVLLCLQKNVAILMSKVVSHSGFDPHFPNDVEHLFLYLLASCVFSLEKCPCKSFVHFKIWVFVFFLLSWKSSVYCMDTRSLLDI